MVIRWDMNLLIVDNVLDSALKFILFYVKAMRYHTREIFNNAVKIHITGTGNGKTDPNIHHQHSTK